MSLTTKAPEKGTYYIVVTFYDEEPKEVVPTSANWTLTDRFGKVINGRENVEISYLDTSVTVVLSGDDLKILYGFHEEERFFSVEYTYDSNLGSDIKTREETSFYVVNYKGTE